MGFRRRIKIKWFRFKIKTAERLRKSVNSDNNRNSDRYLIENGHIFVRISDEKIRIINGKYKYDVSFDHNSNEINDMLRVFMKSLDHRLDKLENEINKRVEKSLDHILKDVED